MWLSTNHSGNDLAGVFEFDGDTGYFYLYKQSAKQDQRIIAAIHIISGMPDFEEKDIAVRWNSDEEIVGLFIRFRLWAAFNSKTIVKYGGNYKENTLPNVPPEIMKGF